MDSYCVGLSQRLDALLRVANDLSVFVESLATDVPPGNGIERQPGARRAAVERLVGGGEFRIGGGKAIEPRQGEDNKPAAAPGSHFGHRKIRPESIRVAYLDQKNQPREMAAEGMLATCILHEMDHLEGILFVDHLSKLKRDLILRRLVKQRKQKAAVNA